MPVLLRITVRPSAFSWRTVSSALLVPDGAALPTNEVAFQVATKDGSKRTDLAVDVILVAVGRRPLTENIGLEAVEGVEVDRGYVKVEEFMRTGAPNLYAIGDIVPGFALAHVASH